MKIASLKNLWHKKIIRLWIVILLPLAILSGYGSYSYKDKYEDTFTNSLVLLLEENELKTNGDSVSASSLHAERLKVEDLCHKYAVKSNVCQLIAGILFFFPTIVWLIIRVYNLIMYGRMSPFKAN